MEEFGGGKLSQSVSQSTSKHLLYACFVPRTMLRDGKISSKRLNPCYQVHGIMMGKMHVNIKILQYSEMRAQALWEAKERGANG